LNTTLEKLEGNRVRVTVSHTAAEVDAAIAAAYLRVARQVKLPGFRPGKAPRPLIDGHVGRESVLAEAVEELVESSYPRAVDELRLRPMSAPDTGDLDLIVEGADYTYTAEVDVRPEFTLSSVEDLKAEVPPAHSTDAEVDAQIEYLRDRFATLEVVDDRGIVDGDFGLLSFTGTVDGQTADDLTVDKYLYEVGRGIMPPEFETGILGAKPGDKLHIEFPVPETAANADYVGKPAAFDVEVHEVKAKALPPVDDELASNVGGFETMDGLREDIRTKLDENKAAAHTRLIERGARAALSERLEGEIPGELVAARTEAMSEEFVDSLKDQGMSMQGYLEATDLTIEQLQSDIAREAALRVRDELALEALFRQVGLEYTDEELEHEVEQLAGGDKVPVATMRDRLIHAGVMGMLRERLMHRHATRYLMENVEVVEVDPSAAGAGDKPKPKPKKKATAKKPSGKADDSAKEE
jgi:trigger factor